MAVLDYLAAFREGLTHNLVGGRQKQPSHDDGHDKVWPKFSMLQFTQCKTTPRQWIAVI